MFGYIKVNKETLKSGEFGLYHAFFCGLCLSTKKHFGNISRLTTNFDINFFNVLFHSFLEMDIKIFESTCVASPIKKRSMLENDEILDKLAISNILLMYVNLYDDCLDEKQTKKKVLLKTLKKYYKKAQILYPEMDKEINGTYNSLLNLEKKDCKILDEVCHPFSELTKNFSKIILGEKSNEYIENLSYNLGKWIYLIDALDDLEKDFKKNQYNPLISCIGEFNNSKDFVKNNIDTLNFIFYTTLNKIAESFNDLGLEKYVCVLTNILHDSIRTKTKEIFAKYLEVEKE